MKSLASYMWVVCALGPVGVVHAAGDAPHSSVAVKSDSQAIEHVMKKLFDKPEAPLKVAPVVMEGEFAVAGWLQDSRGGRALLQKRHGQWVIVVCAGDGLRQAATLVQTGMKPDAAKRLASQLALAEGKLPESTLKKFASFEGMLRVDGQATHGHAQGHGHEQGHASSSGHAKH